MKSIVTAIATLAVLAGPAMAQNYPAKPVRLVSAFSPGGGSDIGLRLVAQKLIENGWGSAVVENRPGGGGVVAAEVVKQAPPDGYTLLQSDASAFAINKTLVPDLPYDPVKDFTPITLTWTFPSVLVVPSKSTASTAAELIALAKSRKGGVTYASQGVGSGGHLLGTMFQNALGVPMVHAPYRGAGQAMPDVAAGRVDLIFASLGSVKQYLEAGTVRILAVTSKQRLAELPDVPTMTEIGQPSVFLDIWFGISGPANMPAPLVNTINEAFGKVLKSPDVAKRLAGIGLYAETSTPAQYRDLIQTDIARLGKIVKDANIKRE